MTQREKLQTCFDLREYEALVNDRLSRWKEKGFLKRLWEKDFTLWSSEPVSELSDRMGWLTLPETRPEKLDEVTRFAEEIKEEGLDQALLLGMGGSSLAPEVYTRAFGRTAGNPELIILDSTHPDAVTAARRYLDLKKTLFIVSSKSGTTLETLSLFRYFWRKTSDEVQDAGKHFVAITDPGTPLVALAEERKFRRVFLAAPDVGGRYSALTVFGLLPAALIGVDVGKLIANSRVTLENCTPGTPKMEASALILGAALGELAEVRDKVTLLTSPALSVFSEWLEQLIAESLGKRGKGILPVALEPSVTAEDYGRDRLFIALILEGDSNDALEARLARIRASGQPTIRIDLESLYDLGQQFYNWEVAIASSGSVMGVNPFDQPDVQLAKDFTREIMQRAGKKIEDFKGKPPERTHTREIRDREALTLALEKWTDQSKPGDYFALQAYLAPGLAVFQALQEIRAALLKKKGLATTCGYGPRFLHSTGQLHKGGPNNGLFLQLADTPKEIVSVPETEYSFNEIIEAQAIGDYKALLQRQRRVLRVNLGSETLKGLEIIRELLSR